MPIERSAGGGGAAAGGLTKLVDVTLGADAASLDTGAAAIASGHIAIWVVANLKTAKNSFVDDVAMTFNGDGGANYDLAEWFNSGTASNSSNSGVALTSIKYVSPGTTATNPNYFSTTQFLILGYDHATHWKEGTGSSGSMDTPNSGSVTNESIQFGWRSTAAINQITIVSSTAATNMKSGSRIVVYGLS